MMAPAARPPRMPNPTPQPRQPAWAALGAETAASANTPAAAIAVIVVFMFLPRSRSDRVAITRFHLGFLKPSLSIHAPVRDISYAVFFLKKKNKYKNST